MEKNELVMVVKTEFLAPVLGVDGLITDATDKAVDIIQKHFEYIPRSDAENDPSYKQIIPYVAVCRDGKYFATRRLAKGGESRLHGKLSIGVGGHINPGPDGEGSEALMNGLHREMEEELIMEGDGTLTCLGLINDDSNGVGSVHLGFLWRWDTDGDVTVRETDKLEGRWYTMPELERLYEDMESWTQIAIGAL